MPKQQAGLGCDLRVGGVSVVGVACGSRHSFVWTDTGQAYSFGNNFYAQLGYDFKRPDYKENQVQPSYKENPLFAVTSSKMQNKNVCNLSPLYNRRCDTANLTRFHPIPLIKVVDDCDKY